ncbi:MAG: capsid protein [Defluviitaleaceae bacterium]|nr:capsid protein [Defluviitaleaceae bacterium]
MSNTINYATLFKNELFQKYSKELLTAGLNTEGVSFFGGNTIKLPFLRLKGYKNHSRDGGFNRQAVENENITRVLSHDRNVEFFVDVQDVDETNQVLAAANITNVFETEHAIPETDAYRISKIYQEYERLGGEVDSTILTRENILEVFDDFMQKMDEEEVPQDGRILYVTPAVNKLLSQSEEFMRVMNITSTDGEIKRNVRMLDEVQVVVVPVSRMRSSYDFSDGFSPADGAANINMMLVHPSSVVAVNKHNYIKLWTPGSHTVGDGYLYQNRQYGDLFVLDNRVGGIAINATN